METSEDDAYQLEVDKYHKIKESLNHINSDTLELYINNSPNLDNLNISEPFSLSGLEYHSQVTVPNATNKVLNTADDFGNFISYNFTRGGDFLDPILYILGFIIVVGIALSFAGIIISILTFGFIIYCIVGLLYMVFK